MWKKDEEEVSLLSGSLQPSMKIPQSIKQDKVLGDSASETTAEGPGVGVQRLG